MDQFISYYESLPLKILYHTNSYLNLMPEIIKYLESLKTVKAYIWLSNIESNNFNTNLEYLKLAIKISNNQCFYAHYAFADFIYSNSDNTNVTIDLIEEAIESFLKSLKLMPNEFDDIRFIYYIGISLYMLIGNQREALYYDFYVLKNIKRMFVFKYPLSGKGYDKINIQDIKILNNRDSNIFSTDSNIDHIRIIAQYIKENEELIKKNKDLEAKITELECSPGGIQHSLAKKRFMEQAKNNY